jgi:hypothetical protein
VGQIKQNIDDKDVPSGETFSGYLTAKVVNNIKKSSKDLFLERFLETQMFSNFFCKENDIP